MAGKTKKETQEEVKTEETVAEITEQEENKQEVAETKLETPETQETIAPPEGTGQEPQLGKLIEEDLSNMAVDKCIETLSSEPTISIIERELKDINLPVSVYDNDRLIRTYNIKDHGDDYKEKAIMFANKNGYQIK